MLLYGRIAKKILAYFRTVLDVLKHHRDTLKLNKYKWFQDGCEFAGMDAAARGTQPVHSKNEVFAKIEKSNAYGDLNMLVEIFVLYIQFLLLYEIKIRPCRYILSKQPQPVKSSQKEDMELMNNKWTS